MNNNMTIFDMMYPKYKITKPIRLIEMFSGYGSQALALKYLGVPFEHWRTCEWAVKSIQAYKDIHFQGDNIDYCENMNKDDLVEHLYRVGISSNYNEPMTFEQIKRLNEKQLRTIYNNICSTNNLVNIQQVKGKDLEIVDTDKYEYILTYSFPCITKDSMILTEKGYIPFEQVEVGMKVLTKGNTWEKVVKKFDNGIHQTYYLNAMGFENIHCTDNHKFWVREMYRKGHIPKRYFKEPQFKEVKDITSKDYFGIPVIEVQEEFYTNNLDFWFMLGMYIGDGWLSKKSYDIIISCNDKKLDLLKEKLDINKWHYTINKSGNNCYRFRFSNKEIYNFIKENIGTGCEEKHIPIEIIKLPTKQLEEFYLGYLKSDGCIIDNKHQFSSINRNLIYSISLIINKLYHRPTCIYKIKTSKTKIIEGRTINQKDWYQLRFKITTDKQDKAFYDNGYIWYPFKSLVKANLENVYNMEVENDHSYIVDGCISKNCQDLSLAGKGKGMSDTSTRSGMLWEVERILTECKELGSMPQILLMENVPQVHSLDNMADFHKWQVRLEELGYKNYWQDLIATDYGIPQTRNRCFMVSILGDYSYTFPKPIPLKLKLKDMLEDNVDEKYYLSDELVKHIQKTAEEHEEYTQYERYNGDLEMWCRVWKDKSPTLNTKCQDTKIYVKNATKKGYLEAEEGDGVDISSRMEYHRGNVQKDKIQTLTTSGGNDRGVCVKGIATNESKEWQKEPLEEMSRTLLANKSNAGVGLIDTNLRIRKLTPRECGRLMNVKDEDIDKILKNQSDSSAYHLFGDSICTNCLMAIFGQLLDIEWEKYLWKVQ